MSGLVFLPVNSRCLSTKEENTLCFKAQNFKGDYYDWGKKVLWWGRRIGACKTKIEEMQLV